MCTKTEHQFSLLFIFLLSAELLCGSVESLSTWRYFTKPSLLIALILFFYFNSKTYRPNHRFMILLALIFSLMGDVFLLFLGSVFFLAGLISFFLGHLCYILIFWQQRNSKINPTGLIIILSTYAFGLYLILKDNLGTLLIPVVFYIIVILTMALTAYLRRRKVFKTSFILVFLGAILFIVSDSILALDKFYMPMPFSSISIMLTYALAQYFIVMGLLKSR